MFSNGLFLRYFKRFGLIWGGGMKPRKDINNVSCCCDMNEILFNSLPHNHDFSRSYRRGLFENIVTKGEDFDNQHFLLFPHCFLPSSKEISGFE